MPITQTDFDTLPGSAYLRQSELLSSSESPAAPIPFSPATLWRKVKAGTFPKPVKLSERVSAWKVGDVREWLQSCNKKPSRKKLTKPEVNLFG